MLSRMFQYLTLTVGIVLLPAVVYFTQMEQNVMGTITLNLSPWSSSNVSSSLAYLHLSPSKSSISSTLTYCPESEYQLPELDQSARDTWHTGTEQMIYLYSAYRDPRFLNETRIVAVGLISLTWLTVKPGEKDEIYCQLWFDPSNNQSPVYVRAQVKSMMHRRKERYKAVQFRCMVPSMTLDDSVMWRLAIVSGTPCKQPKSVLVVRQIPKEHVQNAANFTVCLGGPLQLGYNNYKQFVEWVEIASLFGAERFFIYNHSGNKALKPYVDYYKKRGVMEIVPWILPAEVDRVGKPKDVGGPAKELWYRAQFAAINDCLYRHMYRTKYLVFMDLDEIITPRGQSVQDWTGMLQEAQCGNKPLIIVRNVYYPNNWPDDPRHKDSSLIRKLKLNSLLKTQREKFFLNPGNRSKLIVQPEHMSQIQVHTAWLMDKSLVQNDETCFLDPEVGALHHYREIEGSGGQKSAVYDAALDKFEDAIIRRTRYVHRAVYPGF